MRIELTTLQLSSFDAPMISIQFSAYPGGCSSNPVLHHLMHHLECFRHFQLILLLLLLDALCDRVPHLSYNNKTAETITGDVTLSADSRPDSFRFISAPGR